jgi:hypothetical protein
MSHHRAPRFAALAAAALVSLTACASRNEAGNWDARPTPGVNLPFLGQINGAAPQENAGLPIESAAGATSVMTFR